MVFGQGYEPVAGVLGILSSMLIAVSLSNVTGIQFMVPMKRQNQLTMSVIVGAVFDFIINLYLIPHLYSTGVAIATVFTEWLVTAVQFYLVRDFFNIRDIISQGWHYLISGLIMFGVTLILSRQLSPSIMHSLIIIVLGSVVYASVLLLARDQMMLLFINKIREKL